MCPRNAPTSAADAAARGPHPTDTLTSPPQMQTSLITRVAGATLLGGTALAGGTPSLTFTHLGTVDLSSTANPANWTVSQAWPAEAVPAGNRSPGPRCSKRG